MRRQAPAVPTGIAIPPSRTVRLLRFIIPRYNATTLRKQGGFSLSKKYYFDFYASCGSTHKIEFAKQIHKFREHVSRNLYKGRKNVPVRARFFFGIRSKAWFRSRGCSENDSFSTASNHPAKAGWFFVVKCVGGNWRNVTFILHFQLKRHLRYAEVSFLYIWR